MDPQAQHAIRTFHHDTDKPDAMIGRTLSHYRIVGNLGKGGMGVVYKAKDTRLALASSLGSGGANARYRTPTTSNAGEFWSTGAVAL
jgi:serine/threonine protein kinase